MLGWAEAPLNHILVWDAFRNYYFLPVLNLSFYSLNSQQTEGQLALNDCMFHTHMLQ